MRETQILSISATSAGARKPAIAIAACNAGTLGCIDLEFSTAANALVQVQFLRRFTDRDYGIRIGQQSIYDLQSIFAPDVAPAFVVVSNQSSAFPNESALREWVTFGRDQNVAIWSEVVSVSEAADAIRAGVDQIILKGNEAAGRVGHDTSFILLQKWNRFIGQ